MQVPWLTSLLQHWGYAAVFVIVVLGNVGLPVPEETILALAGYLVWRGELNGPLVLLVGFASAVAGDNLGYWIGRRLAFNALHRYAARLGIKTEHLATAEAFVARHGSLGIFVARFLPGLRFAAGPTAGAMRFPATRFAIANTLGAAAYVPLIVGAGYLIGHGFGVYLERLRKVSLAVEWLVLACAALSIAALTLRRWLRRRREAHLSEGRERSRGSQSDPDDSR